MKGSKLVSLCRFKPDVLPGIALAEARCASTMCRLVFNAAAADGQASLNKSTDMMPWDGEGLFDANPTPEGRLRLEIFFAREGAHLQESP